MYKCSTSIEQSEIVHNVKSDIIMTRVHLNLSTLFMVSHVLSFKVSAE